MKKNEGTSNNNNRLVVILSLVLAGLVALGIWIFTGFDVLNNSFDPETTPESSSGVEVADNETFEPCEGIDTSETEVVAFHRILLAESDDGLNFTKTNRVVADRASVPELITDADGNLRLYFIQVACKEKNMKNSPVVAISSDLGKSWEYKRLTIEAPADVPKCLEPGGNPPPVDPDVVLQSDGSYRLYATCPKSNGQKPLPMTYVFSSQDGLNFGDSVAAYEPADGRALDPVVIKIGSTWHMWNGDEKGGTLHATSTDGIAFTENDKFCPIKYTNAKGTERCYINGDALNLSDGTTRVYLFGNSPQEGVKSIITSDGDSWTTEQTDGEYVLSLDPDSDYESKEVGSPSVARMSDGRYLMAYETTIPGSPEFATPGVPK